jgi:NitT/TauT family transport system permease protein
LNVTPVVSFAPGLVILFGFSVLPRFIVTGVIVFFPFLVNSLIGLKSVDPEALEFFHTLHATRREILSRLRIPSSLPFLFAAARIGVPLALVGAVVAEFTTSGSPRGLGAEIEIAYGFGNLPVVYGSVFCLAVIGVLSTMVVVVAERRLLRWHTAFAGREP